MSRDSIARAAAAFDTFTAYSLYTIRRPLWQGHPTVQTNRKRHPTAHRTRLPTRNSLPKTSGNVWRSWPRRESKNDGCEETSSSAGVLYGTVRSPLDGICEMISRGQ